MGHPSSSGGTIWKTLSVVPTLLSHPFIWSPHARDVRDVCGDCRRYEVRFRADVVVGCMSPGRSDYRCKERAISMSPARKERKSHSCGRAYGSECGVVTHTEESGPKDAAATQDGCRCVAERGMRYPRLAKLPNLCLQCASSILM